MNKAKYKKLKCGIELVYLQDNSKNQTYAEIILNYGNKVSDFTFDNKRIHIVPGTAHLLEHALIEHNFLNENAHSYFNNCYVDFNGHTSNNFTSYFINTVKDFNKYFLDLIKIVNEFWIKEEDLENIKQPIYREIEKEQDRLYKEYDGVEYDLLYHQKRRNNIVGEKEAISIVANRTLKSVHDAFYQPNNQIIFLIGNFKIKEVEKIVNDYYEKKQYKSFLIENPEKLYDLKKQQLKVIDSQSNELAEIIFKVNIKQFSSFEKNKLTFYLDFFLSYNFNDSSEAFKKVTEKKYSLYSFNHHYQFYDDNNLLIFISLETTFVRDFKKIVLDIFNQKPVDKEDFLVKKQNCLINIIIGDIYIKEKAQSFLNNILDYKYYEADKIEDINNFNFTDYKDLLNKLDFSDYGLIYQVKK